MPLDAYGEMMMRNAKWKAGLGQQWGANAAEAARQSMPRSFKPFPKWMSGHAQKVTNLGSKYAPGGVRASAGAAGSNLLALIAAAQAGYGTGRVLGKTPLMTDPNMTYDQWYQDKFKKMLLEGMQMQQEKEPYIEATESQPFYNIGAAL